MRKIIIFIFLCLTTSFTSAQKPVISGNQVKPLIYDKTYGKETVTLILFDSINPATLIEYNGTDVKWYNFADLTTPINTFNSYNPENATGYIIDVDGKRDTIWVIDYSKYKPHFYSLVPENKPTEQCENVTLLLDALIPDLYYKTPKGDSITIPRYFTINYQTLLWPDYWVNKPTSAPETKWDLRGNKRSITSLTVPAPLCNTKFTLSGDQFTDKDSLLELDPDTIASIEYKAVAVKCYPTSILSTRLETNEAERPSQASQISGSVPLEIEFLSNANIPVAKYYKWDIYKDKQLIISRTDADQRYTFNDAVTYKVLLTVTSDSKCTYSDSITITASESQIQVPNVFTPNGDGVNDEFRVAYKSILTFDCWVYNRWGRLVYHWNDPRRGWDGNINGKKATPGPYFYVIKAVGSDDEKYTKNKKEYTRKKEYLLKGDINLLRGKE